MTAATLVWWKVVIDARACLSLLDSTVTRCTAADVLRRLVNGAYKSGIGVNVSYAVVIGFAFGILAVEFTVVLLWRIAEFGAYAWRAIEDRAARRLLSPLLGFALLYGMTLLPFAAFWALAILLRFR